MEIKVKVQWANEQTETHKQGRFQDLEEGGKGVLSGQPLAKEAITR